MNFPYKQFSQITYECNLEILYELVKDENRKLAKFNHLTNRKQNVFGVLHIQVIEINFDNIQLN